MKRPRVLSTLIGRRVRTSRELTTGQMVIPAGSVLTVRSIRPGLELQGERCSCCGVRPIVRRVDVADVELVTDDPQPQP